MPVSRLDTTNTAGQPDAKGNHDAIRRTFRIRYAKAEDVASILRNDRGSELNLNVQVDARTNSVLVMGPASAVDAVSPLINDLDQAAPQVMIDATIFRVDPKQARKLGFLDSADNSPNKVAVNGPPSAAGGSRRVPEIRAALEDLEAKGLAQTLASPRLIAINGSQAQLRIGDKIVFSSGPSMPPEERDVGLCMDITALIGKDNFVTMRVNVEQTWLSNAHHSFPTVKRLHFSTEARVADGGEMVAYATASTEESMNEEHSKKNKKASSRDDRFVILVRPRIVRLDGGYDPFLAAPSDGCGDGMTGGMTGSLQKCEADLPAGRTQAPPPGTARP